MNDKCKEDPTPKPTPRIVAQMSVTELCANHENLREYIAQLEVEREALIEELQQRDKKDRAERVASGTYAHQLNEIKGRLDNAGIRSHWDYTSGISAAVRVKMLIEREEALRARVAD